MAIPSATEILEIRITVEENELPLPKCSRFEIKEESETCGKRKKLIFLLQRRQTKEWKREGTGNNSRGMR
jgi:hypothetical protein